MPIYEYRCNDCLKSFEKLVLLGREKEIICSFCESSNIEKKISKFAFTSKNAEGTTLKSSSSGCSSCSATSCSTCHS